MSWRPPRHRSLKPPPETEGAEETEAVGREPTVDLCQPKLGDPPFTEDQEDDDAMLEYFGDVCRIHIDKVRQIYPPNGFSSSLGVSSDEEPALAQTACCWC
jgi:hypothetical protein